jgi:hypothetical protein
MQFGLFVPLCSSRKLTAKFDIQPEGLRENRRGGHTGCLVRNNDPKGLDQGTGQPDGAPLQGSIAVRPTLNYTVAKGPT